SRIYALSWGLNKNTTLTITNLSSGAWDIYAYSYQATFQLKAGTTDYGSQTNRDLPPANPLVWKRGLQYTLFTNVLIPPNQPLVINISTNFDPPFVSGLQLILHPVREVTLSTNSLS